MNTTHTPCPDAALKRRATVSRRQRYCEREREPAGIANANRAANCEPRPSREPRIANRDRSSNTSARAARGAAAATQSGMPTDRKPLPRQTSRCWGRFSISETRRSARHYAVPPRHASIDPVTSGARSSQAGRRVATRYIADLLVGNQPRRIVRPPAKTRKSTAPEAPVPSTSTRPTTRGDLRRYRRATTKPLPRAGGRRRCAATERNAHRGDYGTSHRAIRRVDRSADQSDATRAGGR